jgi:hypothetical protein
MLGVDPICAEHLFLRNKMNVGLRNASDRSPESGFSAYILGKVIG